MQPDKKVLDALAEKAKEQSKELTLWAQRELGLSPEFQVKIKISTKYTPPPKRKGQKRKNDPRGWVYDQDPSPTEWAQVIKLVRSLAANAKPYKRSGAMWRYMTAALQELRKGGNRGYVWNATRLNLYLQQHGHPYQLVRVDGPGEDTLYSFKVVRPLTQSEIDGAVASGDPTNNQPALSQG